MLTPLYILYLNECNVNERKEKRWTFQVSGKQMILHGCNANGSAIDSLTTLSILSSQVNCKS